MQYIFSVFLICHKHTCRAFLRAAFHRPRDGKPVPYNSSINWILAKPALAPSLRGLSEILISDWGSVLCLYDTPSVFAFGEATSLKEGGKGAAAPLR